MLDEPEARADGNAETVGTADITGSRRDQIITAADDLLSQCGLDGLTIRAVLTRTGLARRALYENFGGKDDLVLAVFEQTLLRAAGQFGELIGRIDDPLARLRVIVTGIVLGPFGVDDEATLDRRSAAFSREHLRLAEARPDELDHALRPLVALITTQVDAGIQAGRLRRGDPALIARLIYNLVSTTTHTELLSAEHSPNRADREQLAGAIWDFCQRAIVA